MFSGQLFVEDALSQYTFRDERDRSLAYEICCGTVRLKLQLEWIATQLSAEGKLNLKNREKSLLLPALYQIYYLEKVPHYAVIHETVELAKKSIHSRIANFLNGILRKATETPLQLPNDHSVGSLSIRYSQYPSFVRQLIEERGLESTLQILEASNQRPLHFVHHLKDPFQYKPIHSVPSETEGYIQNPTPGKLIHFLSEDTPKPQNILDLCASPGGKLLLAHALYPEAELYANDLTEKRIHRLQENIEKFSLNVKVSVGPGEEFPEDTLFDLIILDVPCSNSGVLNKRVEARWRLTPEALNDLKSLQLKLLEKSSRLLKKGGSIWFLTCSILKEENELLTDASGLLKVKEMTCLPDKEGNDGGYGCLLRRV